MLDTLFERRPNEYFAEIRTLSGETLTIHQDFNFEIEEIDKDGKARGRITENNIVISEYIEVTPNFFQLIHLKKKLVGED